MMAFLIASLTLLGPQGSIDPFVFGQRYCWLRQHGVDRQAAIDQAIDTAWRPRRSGSAREIDIDAARNFIETNCNG
jgi:hypothetical protein